MATNKSRESMEINTKKVVEPRPHSQVLQARPERYPIIVTDLEKSIGDFAAMLGQVRRYDGALNDGADSKKHR